MKLVYLLVIVFVQKSFQNAIPVVVRRRLTGDFEYFAIDYPENFVGCTDVNSSNVTYLVEERRCVTGDDLLKGN